MNIEAGKFYKTRNGMKVRIYATDGGRINDPSNPDNFYDEAVHGAFFRDGYWYMIYWGIDGVLSRREMKDFDIVSPWFDPPLVDWDKFPKHIIALAMNDDGTWRGYLDRPNGINEKQGVWYLTERPYFRAMFEIKPADYPIFSGDWRDSLVIRPGYEKLHIRSVEGIPF